MEITLAAVGSAPYERMFKLFASVNNYTVSLPFYYLFYFCIIVISLMINSLIHYSVTNYCYFQYKFCQYLPYKWDTTPNNTPLSFSCIQLFGFHNLLCIKPLLVLISVNSSISRLNTNRSICLTGHATSIDMHVTSR